jgi:hypothetical protein
MCTLIVINIYLLKVYKLHLRKVKSTWTGMNKNIRILYIKELKFDTISP